MQEFFGQFNLLKEEIERYRKSNYTVIVQATSHHNLQQLHKNLEEYGIRLDYIDGDTIIPQASQLVVGGLALDEHLPIPSFWLLVPYSNQSIHFELVKSVSA